MGAITNVLAASPSPYDTVVRREAAQAGVPADIADAVIAIESGYDPTRIGSVGEIGLMQVRPETAALLGFSGTTSELARPETNIHYGVSYLAGAWAKAGGDLCRALMKYRAGHGQEIMSPLSEEYCARARAHLAEAGWEISGTPVPLIAPAAQVAAARMANARPPALNRRLRGAAFWAVEEARVRAITARLHQRWRVASSAR